MRKRLLGIVTPNEGRKVNNVLLLVIKNSLIQTQFIKIITQFNAKLKIEHCSVLAIQSMLEVDLIQKKMLISLVLALSSITKG